MYNISLALKIYELHFKLDDAIWLKCLRDAGFH